MGEKKRGAEEEARRILVVEDDADLAASIAKYLSLDGYLVKVVGSALQCYVALEAGQFDLAILDLSLPDQDGLVLSRFLRSNTGTIVLMLSARSSFDDRRMAYEAGAHLFLAKPVEFAEVSSSVASLLGSETARYPAEPSRPAARPPVRPLPKPAAGWRLLRAAGELVSPAGESARLTTKELELLQLLAEGSQETVPRDSLLTALGYPHDEYGHRALESILYRLRKKASPLGGLPLRTSHGIGYAFMAPLDVS